MATRNVKRKLVAILAADAVGFSRLMGGDEEQTMRVLNAHRSVIDGIIEYHEGRIVGTAGDSVLAEFGSPVEAVRCAVEIQDALKTRNDSLPETQRLHFRIGINLGDVMIKGDDLLGDGVNIAARLESIAEPGGICISSSVYDQIAGKLDLGFVEIGEQQLKNIERPIRVYRVRTGVTRPAPAPSAPTRKAPSRWLYAAGGAAVVLVAIAAVLRLREAPPAPAEPVTAAAPAPAPEVEAQRAQEAQRMLEAQQAAEERSKSEITVAKARADAEIAKARAEAEVARARAETETVRRQAAAELAAARAKQAETRPPAPRLAAPAAPAPVTPAEVASAPPPAPVAPALQSAVVWSGRLSCEQFMEKSAFTDYPVRVTVIGHEFTLETGKVGQPGYLAVRGKPQSDGTLVLAGYFISGASVSHGQELKAFFEGRLEGDRYEGTGRTGGRACVVMLARRQAAAEIATARAKQADAAPPAPQRAAAAASSATPARDTPAASATAWSAQRKCDPFENLPSITDRLTVRTNGEEFILETGQPGQPRYFLLQGKPSADGALALTGHVISGARSSVGRGQELPVVFRGHLAGDSYELTGRIGRRTCTLLVTRRQP